MKITILNGSPERSSFDLYVADLASKLKGIGNSVTQIDLRSLSLHHCVGCFGCWVKTPGLCVSRDASLEMDSTIINSDFVLWASPLRMGFPTELLKMALDKHLPLIHPYMEVAYGEAHHLRRYQHYPRVGLLLEKEASTDERDLQIVKDIFCRTAINFKTRMEFSFSTETAPMVVAGMIQAPAGNGLPIPDRLPPTKGVIINPPSKLTLFNGSPRGRHGNTPLMLEHIAEGFNRPSEMKHLVYLKRTEEMVQAFAQAECAIIGFPLYTDAMPGVVKHFFEALEPLIGRRDNPPVGFLVQSGFPEALHSRYIERYLERLASRLGSPYLGTIVKGGGEGTRTNSPLASRGLFTNLQALGAGLAAQGWLDPVILQAVAKPERFPSILGPFFQIFLRLPVAHSYFDSMLKENGAYELRLARPLID